MKPIKPNHRKAPFKSLSAVTAAILLLAAGTAAAASPIEGVWSFNGGQIAVHEVAGGSFTGTVVAETKFAECSHPVGQSIWTSMSLQPDGSYRGLHQWYFEDAACTENPTLGPTAWRILPGPAGSHFLRACFSSPGTSQPMIAPDGSSTAATYGCVDSARAGALASGTLSLKTLVSLPSPKACFSKRSFLVHVRDPQRDPFKHIDVAIDKHRLAVRRSGKFSVASVNLRGLPQGTFVLRIDATTVLGRHLSGHRTYHTCRKPRRSKRART